MEIAMYIILYLKIRINDEAMIGPVPIEKVRLRHKRSAINLTGQIVSFVVETLITLIIQIFLHKILAHGATFGITAFPCYMVVSSGINSIAQFVSSPEMRRFYLKENI